MLSKGHQCCARFRAIGLCCLEAVAGVWHCPPPPSLWCGGGVWCGGVQCIYIYIYMIPVPGPVAPPPLPPMVWSPTRCTSDLTFTRCLQTQPAIACYLLRLGDVKPCLWAIRKHLGSPIPYLQAFRSIYALLPLLRTHTSTRLLPPPFLPCQRATYVLLTPYLVYRP